jgi:hypothetical protein
LAGRSGSVTGVVNKSEKSSEERLPPGPILPSDLAAALRTAATDATYMRVWIRWSDDHTATVRDIDELEPIEDAAGIESVDATFNYADDSDLEIDLRLYRDCTVSAKGRTARERKSMVAQQWAAIPGRGRLTRQQSFWAWNMSQSFVVGSMFSLALGLFFAFFVHVHAALPLGLGAAAAAVCIYLAVRRTPSVRALSKMVVLERKSDSRVEFWTVVAGLAAVIALLWGVIWGVFTYVYPGK